MEQFTVLDAEVVAEQIVGRFLDRRLHEEDVYEF